jgi:hypothetical protein
MLSLWEACNAYDTPERYRELSIFEHTGDSYIIDPRGEIIAGPAEGEMILTAEGSMEAVLAAKAAADIGGHYSGQTSSDCLSNGGRLSGCQMLRSRKTRQRLCMPTKSADWILLRVPLDLVTAVFGTIETCRRLARRPFIGVKPEVIDGGAVETFWQHVDEEAADELVGGERHPLVSIAALDAVILRLEGDAACSKVIKRLHRRPRSAPPCTSEPWRGIEQPRYFLHAEHHRQLARLVNDTGMLDDLVAFKRGSKNMLRWADMKPLLDRRRMV